MAEWLKTAAIARRAGYSAPGVLAMIYNGVIPPECVRITHGKYRDYYQISTDVIQMLIEHKQEWHAAIKQPDGVIHVPDPLGVQEGLWLTPDEAQRLLAIRELKRRYPTTQERNEAMRGDG